ncbi:MAG: TRAP transporter fused permease subunit [Planctomycetes bacterium]|nr:TRAP transporter fused permease subunit [Planctomycetota bacterium]
MIDRVRRFLVFLLAVALSLYTIYEVNYSILPPRSQLAVFCMLGMLICFQMYPLSKRFEKSTVLKIVDFALCIAAIVCCGYLVWQGSDLTGRPGAFTETDFTIGILGTILVIEATRRSIGWALPILAGTFLLYAYYGSQLPEWAFFHKGYDIDRIAAQSFLRSAGVFGTAMRVMFGYVFLFVVFGAFLEMSGATRYIIDFAERVFGRSPGGSAKVSVLASGLMGSLSGSAVANAMTTGTFTIPMMRSAGFKPHIAGGITAAAASGGALVPPVMGAGAYMMLELIDDVTFVQIMRAAIVPAVLYYLSILLIVHFYARRIGNELPDSQTTAKKTSLLQYEGLVFFGALGSLITFLLMHKTPFRSVTYSLEIILVLTIISPKIKIKLKDRIVALSGFAVLTGLVAVLRTQLKTWIGEDGGNAALEFLSTVLAADSNLSLSNWTTYADAAIPGLVLLLLLGLVHPVWKQMIGEAFLKSARGGVSLVSASGCVGIVIGVVSLTGVGTAFPNAVIPLAEQSLFLALIAIMVCSIVLGMGLPSAVCYLLMATLIGPVLNKLGVPPLAAHFFIFYFGMMSMVTPPVALAAYATASLANARIMPTALAAFRFALVGFTLPFMFIYRTELLLLSDLPEPVNLRTDSKPDDRPGKISGLLKRFGQPVEKAVLRIFAADATETDAIKFQTDDKGKFSLKMKPGRYTVEFKDEKDDWRLLGVIDFDPTRGAPSASGKKSKNDERVLFEDDRLSLLAVMLAIGFAVIGIVALAAGITGFLFAEIRVSVRVAMLGAAALLLSPDVAIGETEIGILTNIAGTVLFAVTAAVNYLRAKQLP